MSLAEKLVGAVRTVREKFARPDPMDEMFRRIAQTGEVTPQDRELYRTNVIAQLKARDHLEMITNPFSAEFPRPRLTLSVRPENLRVHSVPEEELDAMIKTEARKRQEDKNRRRSPKSKQPVS